MKTSFHFFPFDLFGSGGTGAGVDLLADAVREMLEDNRRETVPTRARAYNRKVRLTEWSFEKLDDYQDWRALAGQAIRAETGNFPVWVSGNHLGALPIYDELGEDDLVLQFDAHLDIFNLADCSTELSHGNFLLHARKPLPAIINVGHRDLLMRRDHVDRYYRAAFSALAVKANGEGLVKQAREAMAGVERVWIDLDCDVFDAAYFPGIAQSLPFGLSPLDVLGFLEAVWSDKVVGLSLSEFDTARDTRDQSLATLVWLLEWVLLKVHGG